MTALVYLATVARETESIRNETKAARNHGIIRPSFASLIFQVADLLEGLAEQGAEDPRHEAPTEVLEGRAA